MGLDDNKYPPKKTLGFIDYHKERGVRSKDIPDRTKPHNKQLVAVYEIYEKDCADNGLLDFPEILLKLMS